MTVHQPYIPPPSSQPRRPWTLGGTTAGTKCNGGLSFPAGRYRYAETRRFRPQIPAGSSWKMGGSFRIDNNSPSGAVRRVARTKTGPRSLPHTEKTSVCCTSKRAVCGSARTVCSSFVQKLRDALLRRFGSPRCGCAVGTRPVAISCLFHPLSQTQSQWSRRPTTSWRDLTVPGNAGNEIDAGGSQTFQLI